MKKENFILPAGFISQVYNTGFSTFNISKQITKLLTKTCQGWKQFNQDKLISKVEYKLGKKKSEKGWVERRGELKEDGGLYDIKSFFNYNPYFRESWKNNNSFSKYEDWFNNLDTLHEYCTKASLIIAQGFDQRFLGKRIEAQVRASRRQNILRLLYYPERPLLNHDQEKKDGFAQAHFDRDLWTFSLMETLPGLRIGKNLEISYEYKKNQVLFFAGAKFSYLTNNIIKPVNHGVINSALGPRIAIVFFAHIPLSEKTTTNYSSLLRSKYT